MEHLARQRRYSLRVFTIQGFDEVAKNLTELIMGGDQLWDAYLKSGIDVRGGGLTKRVSFKIDHGISMGPSLMVSTGLHICLETRRSQRLVYSSGV